MFDQKQKNETNLIADACRFEKNSTTKKPMLLVEPSYKCRNITILQNLKTCRKKNFDRKFLTELRETDESNQEIINDLLKNSNFKGFILLGYHQIRLSLIRKPNN